MTEQMTIIDTHASIAVILEHGGTNMINENDIKDYKAAGYPQPEKFNPDPGSKFSFNVLKEAISANEKQIAGDHYKEYGDLQPWDVVLAWKLGYLEGTALKYIARHKKKNGKEDIQKAIHFLEKLLEVYDKI